MPSKRIRREDLLQGYAIGAKLKTLRASKRLTLARLSVETGYSTALLSKLETERMVPTLSTLAKLCTVYGVNLGYFFSESQHHSVAITRQAHLSDERRESSGVKRTLLHLPSATGRQLCQVVDIPAGSTLNISDRDGRTELTAFVIFGTLHISAGTSEEELRAGDCLVLDTDEALILTAPDSACRVLSVRAK